MAKVGRPSKYTDELAANLFKLISEGKPVDTACKSVGINTDTLYGWIDSRDGFSEQYARAKERAMEKMADEILSIADDGSQDEIELEDQNGRPYTKIDHDHINRSRLRVDTRKWLMSKLAPKKYGDKVSTEITGANGGPLIAAINLTVTDGKLKE